MRHSQRTDHGKFIPCAVCGASTYVKPAEDLNTCPDCLRNVKAEARSAAKEVRLAFGEYASIVAGESEK